MGNRYWIDQGAPNADFWAHEFSKHATCFSTFDPPCYGPQSPLHSEIVDFFSTAVAYYQIVPTWGWLATASIYPSNSTTYSLNQFQTALKAGFGATPYVGCSGPRWNETESGKGSLDNGRTVVSEMWYYFHVYGRVQGRQGVPVEASINGGSVSNCVKVDGALKYPERTMGSEV
jgi:ribonuclease T2